MGTDACHPYFPVQEVLAVTLIVAGGKPSEIASHFKEAFQRYTTASGTRAPRSGVRAATRTMLLLADYCRGTGHHGEANYALMKAHFQACFVTGQVRSRPAWTAIEATTVPSLIHGSLRPM